MRNKRKLRILWRHPNLRDYRIPLFNYLTKIYDIHFLFSRQSAFDYKYAHTVYGSKLISQSFDLRSLINLSSLLMRSDYDIFISSFSHSPYTIIGLIAARLRGKKVIIWEEKWTKKTKTKFMISTLLIKLIAIRLVDAFFACGSCQRDYLKSLGASDDRIFIANESSLDLSKAGRQEIDLCTDIKDKKVFLLIGRIIDWKGLDYLMKAFSYIQKETKDTFLLVVGSGDYKPFCLELARELNLSNYHFAGQINDLSIKRYVFEISYAVVVPSIVTTDHAEGGPIVVPEAFSTGTPVIASDAVGSANDLILDGINGYTFHQKNSKDLAEKLLLMLTNPEYDVMCKYARKTYESRCNYKFITEVLSSCIQSVYA